VNKNDAIAADAGDAVSIPIEQDCCAARGPSYADPAHVHVCTIVLVDDPEDDAHEFHACYCGDWWHDR
jgi:hypothetical protein